MDKEMTQLLFAEETYAIRGAVFEVYREMGSHPKAQIERFIF